MSGKTKKDPWAGWPEELHEILYSLYHDDGKHGHEEALAYLRESLARAESSGGECALDWLSWVNELFLFCFDPEIHLDAWRRCATSALELICEAERLLSKTLPELELPSSRDVLPDPDVLDMVCLQQDLNAFGCIAAGFAGEDKEFAARLNIVVKATKQCVRYDADQWKAINSGKRDPGACYDKAFSGPRLWKESLAFAARAAPHMNREADVIDAYKRYISYLEGSLQWGAPVLSDFVGAKMEIERLEGKGWDGPGGEWPPF